MSYNQFNLTTLQLPVPASNMTKAEYKDAYGIDLDSIDINKFTLVLFGKEKYAIDKIKIVESGYEIFFDGRILSITDTVQVSDNIYDIENAKPIYFHPISMYNSSLGSISFVIINTSSEEYNTATKLKSAIANFQRVSPITGSWKFGTETLLPAYGYLQNSEHRLLGVYLDGTIEDGTGSHTLQSIIDNSTNVSDGVNKIN